MDSLIAHFNDLIAFMQQTLFEGLIQPVMFALGLAVWIEDAYNATEIFLYGIFEIALLYAVLRPLEALFPLEHWTNRKAIRVDVIYTLLDRLGILPLFMFALLLPVETGLDEWLRMQGYVPYDLERLAPTLANNPLASFFIYLLLLDLAEYWRHRLSHYFNAWWELHAVHHSQQQLSFWSDSRNHLLDTVTANLWFTVIALLIGVQPSQFIGLILLTRLLQSFSHANLRVSFGWLGERLLVSPHYHRLHHAIGIGHEGVHRGCNFAVLFPVWDVLFGTANFSPEFPATGVRSQVGKAGETGRDYGAGFWAQQRLGLQRMWAALKLGVGLGKSPH